MVFNYPKLRKNTAFHLLILLALQIFLIIYICLVAIHGTWRHKRWMMQNNKPLRWELGLTSIHGSIDCGIYSDTLFYSACMTIFRRTFGSLGTVQAFICNLNTARFNGVNDIHIQQLRNFVNSCPDLTDLLAHSTIILILLISCCALFLLETFAIIRLAYKRFEWKYRTWYWVAFGCSSTAFCLHMIAVLWYSLSIPQKLHSAFNYEDPLDISQSLIISNDDGGEVGSAISLIIGAIIVLFLLIILGLLWIPIVPPGVSAPLRKKMTIQETENSIDEPSSTYTKEVFWAYMPEIFQPNIYILEDENQPIEPDNLLKPGDVFVEQRGFVTSAP